MPPKILVAEDDRLLLDAYREFLGDRGYHLTFADSVSAAAEHIRTGRYDLLITDLMFPDGMGTELATLFANSHGGRSLMVTSSPPEPQALASWPVHRCLRKPVTREELLAAVAEALN
jgi:DNA-binding response OmpR family regulator